MVIFCIDGGILMMTGFEMDNFYQLDKKEYILENNLEFMKWYSCFVKEGFQSILNLEQMQNLIEEIANFFEIKYPNRMLEKIIYGVNIRLDDSFKDVFMISKLFDINQLKYRLHHDKVQFLECSYGNVISLEKEKKHLFDLDKVSIRVFSDGTLDKFDLEFLQISGFLEDISGIDRIENLFGRLESIPTDINYSELKKWIEYHRNCIFLRNRVLALVPLKLLYSESSNPDFGYFRAKSFVRMFNKEYGTGFNLQQLDQIMAIDYSKKDCGCRKLKKVF